MNLIEKRYQVFVSSTYTDLIEERAEVMQALLELNCMPAGMELFPAANDTQWNWIKKVIDESDYYIVIVGGRYGTISQLTGQSYTEMEYRYAVEKGKPVIGFTHENPSTIPSGKCEQTPKAIKSLESFREFVQSRLCKHWSSPTDLGAKVSRSITQLIKQYPAVGWVKADLIPSESSASEILKLRKKIETLESALEKAGTEKPAGTDLLANGKDSYRIDFSFKRKIHSGKSVPNPWRAGGEGTFHVVVAWDQIFAFIAPSMINGIGRWELSRKLDELTHYYGYPSLEKHFPNERFDSIQMFDECFRTILIQLRALKLISSSSGKNGETWNLTPYGDNYMTKLLAVHRNLTESKSNVGKK